MWQSKASFIFFAASLMLGVLRFAFDQSDSAAASPLSLAEATSAADGRYCALAVLGRARQTDTVMAILSHERRPEMPRLMPWHSLIEPVSLGTLIGIDLGFQHKAG